MKKIIICTLMATSLTAIAAPTNYMTYIGGGGEPTGAATTQFDLGVSNFSNFVNDEKKNYNVTVNFNGGHRDTEIMLKEKFKDHKVVENFNQANFDKMIADYTDKLEKNQIPENGKILLFINSHGGETAGATHNISAANSAMTNYNTGSKDGMISLDSLAKLTELAEKKKVKMAIIDASCHSGNSLKLANSKTCVISSSGPKHYGFSNFGEIFASHMMRGRNLEEIFLITREATAGNGFPEISTPEGIQVQDELYPLLTPFMYFHDEYRGAILDKIDTYLKENAKGSAINACERQNEFVKLNEVLKLIEDITAVEKGLFKKSMERSINLDLLREKIKAYRDVQEDYIKKLSEITMGNLQKMEPLDLGNGVRSPGYTHEQLLGTDWNYFINEKNRDLQDRSLPESRRKSLEETKVLYTKALEKKAQMLRDYPEYDRFQGIINSLKTDAAVSNANASSIAKEAQIAYAAYYKNRQDKLKAANKSATNACKDFVL